MFIVIHRSFREKTQICFINQLSYPVTYPVQERDLLYNKAQIEVIDDINLPGAQSKPEQGE